MIDSIIYLDSNGNKHLVLNSEHKIMTNTEQTYFDIIFSDSNIFRVYSHRVLELRLNKEYHSFISLQN